MTDDSSVETTNNSEVETPVGVNHLVLNVHDIEESHRLWTEIIGLKQVGTSRPRTDMGKLPAMRFYSGNHGGMMAHHDVALLENPNLPPRPKKWEIFGGPQAINHIAIAVPNREFWLNKLAKLQTKGIKFNLRINHGMTHSVYIGKRQRAPCRSPLFADLAVGVGHG